MKVREVNVSEADKASARIFFNAVCDFYDLKSAKALDMFARTGDLTVVNYAARVSELHLWELGGEHEEALRAFNPASVHIGCSYQTAIAVEDRFDFIVIDSPQGAHHDYNGTVHYEHFDVLEDVLPKLVSKEAVVVLYVNKRPYDKNVLGEFGYDQYAEYDFKSWMEARIVFYGTSVISEGQALDAYKKCLTKIGMTVENALVTPCYSDVPGYEPYAFRVALKVKRY